MEDIVAHGRGMELDDLSGPFQPTPFYDSMLLHSQYHVRSGLQ